ncbi:guanidinobutyrase-like [Liolophura sinensis]|uniref:guanidinobutyrase-like n=1 Tax=Liolophura sinensis TaxID=3198878 RepID=UPI003158477A
MAIATLAMAGTLTKVVTDLCPAFRRTSLKSVRCTRLYSSRYNQPLSGNVMPRPGGIASMMRLPVQNNTDGLDACFVGVPLDIGTSHKSGSRMGPRHIRTESVMLRPVNIATGAAPFESLQVADVGDVAFNLYNLPEACQDIRNHFSMLIQDGCKPLALGGDHTMSYPILQAIKEKYGPVGLVHLDAHPDTADVMSNSKTAHGTPFRRAFEEGCLDPKRVVSIGLRGPAPDHEPYQWGIDQGFRVIRMEEYWHKPMTPLMAEVRAQMGKGPVYLTFDIDVLDPSFAPGTGFPEVAGMTSIQALEVIRGCRGLNLIGCDLVEVNPSYDPTGRTAILAANLLFEILCVFPGVKYHTKS